MSPPIRCQPNLQQSPEQGVDRGLQQLTHQDRGRLRKGFAKQAGRVDNVWSGHRDDSVRVFCGRLTRRITRWPRLRR